MDSVHGTQSGKVLLTFLFRTFSLILAFPIDRCSKTSVKEAIDKLYGLLGHEVFKRCFPVISIDNGFEFKKPQDLELDAKGNQSTKIFYCNPWLLIRNRM